MAKAFDPGKLTNDQQAAVLDNLKQGAAAHLVGKQSGKTLRDTITAPRNSDGSYSGPRLAKWWWTQREAVVTPEPELAGDGSPALERYRSARAEIAEYDLQIRRGDLMARVDVHAGLSEAGAVLRRKVARLRKEFGDEAAQIITDAVEDMLRANERLFGGTNDRSSGE